MRVWRLCNARHAATAFDGEGARQFGGRWNSPGKAAVYTAATRSLAALELLVYLFEVAQAPLGYVVIAAELPDDLPIEHVALADLPADWQRAPSQAERGDRWLSAGRSAVLAVPSVVTPDERNYVLNPRHPDFRRIKVGSAAPFAFDPRLTR
jgi:RES domain-containing protein